MVATTMAITTSPTRSIVLGFMTIPSFTESSTNTPVALTRQAVAWGFWVYAARLSEHHPHVSGGVHMNLSIGSTMKVVMPGIATIALTVTIAADAAKPVPTPEVQLC